jgi:hypothetical protein
MTNWIYLSKAGEDEYINMFAKGSGGTVTNTDDFDYKSSKNPIVLRGILKHKLMKRCWKMGRTFYYMDSGYFGNLISAKNPMGFKKWHRIVKNDLQHGDIVSRPSDRWLKMDLPLEPRRYGSRIVLAAPDEKPCKFYGIDQSAWIEQTIDVIKQHTDRDIIVRMRASSRDQRVRQDPLHRLLTQDVHALVTYNSNSAVESIMKGVPAFVLAPSHAAMPVANTDLKYIDDPYWPDSEKIFRWACHLAYGQFSVKELQDGTAYRILNEL